MEKAYTIKPVRAEQFTAASKPWPTGVSIDTMCMTGYVYVNEFGMKFMICDGDYIKVTKGGRVVVAKAEFEDQYQ